MSKDLCIVIARGGSKRVPRKNIRHIAGRPLVAWPTAAATASRLFQHVLISTEDIEIAQAAQLAGAEYPFARPIEVADDFSTTADVLRTVLQQWKAYSGNLPAFCCCLYGTSVFVNKDQLRSAKELLSTTELVLAVSEYSHPIQRALKRNEEGDTDYIHPEFINTRTQDLEKSYHDIGLFYYFSVEAFLRHGGCSFGTLKKKSLIVPRTSAVDIDSEEDLAWANILAQYNGLGK